MFAVFLLELNKYFVKDTKTPLPKILEKVYFLKPQVAVHGAIGNAKAM